LKHFLKTFTGIRSIISNITINHSPYAIPINKTNDNDKSQNYSENQQDDSDILKTSKKYVKQHKI